MAYQTINPTTNVLVKTYPNHTDADVEAALDAAHRLYKSPWSKGPIQPRLQVLERLAYLIDARKEELAQIATVEMGKLISDARDEVWIIAEIARFYARHAEKFLAPVKIDSSLGEAWVEHHPIGVMLAVEPWNFPYYQLMRVFAPNLAAGNPVVAKHASIVPHCATVFEELVNEAGAPKGAWKNLFITADQVAKIIADDRVQGAAMTGSEGAGSAIAAQAGKYLKKSTLEMGGNDVFVVLDDADLEKAVETGVFSRLHISGQECICAKRFVLHETIADKFLENFTAAMASVKIGDPMDETTKLGPLSSADASANLAKQVQRALDHGAKLYLGGKPIDGKGNFFAPTILTNVTRDNPAYFEEFFGPVAQIYVVKDDDEAVTLANDSRYGLAGVVFSRNIERAKALASRIETGAVWINTFASTAPELPFGGVKRSGYGRELSELGIKEFVNQKLVLVAKG
ncbi:NAD-dependent succinate-semialdehyde dehydrogenase [Acidisoma cellulosilytica]|uniref:NAD-dependent succinate-semialdehyde dehydrogenase n=1 Tax=Acidisoma cellulosilyticum TaxID=2802395 RepID=A0A963YX99_9PROT|nr:NAD-dependent succinate-semialdehyde dehydrogenase [Acidisoma cellulosilyticum]MCB8878848.1 NAD-dependent succinate-semialdehyde dehydrogenase [Acidisoma cellulosilyticum]